MRRFSFQSDGVMNDKNILKHDIVNAIYIIIKILTFDAKLHCRKQTGEWERSV